MGKDDPIMGFVEKLRELSVARDGIVRFEYLVWLSALTQVPYQDANTMDAAKLEVFQEISTKIFPDDIFKKVSSFGRKLIATVTKIVCTVHDSLDVNSRRFVARQKTDDYAVRILHLYNIHLFGWHAYSWSNVLLEIIRKSIHYRSFAEYASFVLSI